LNIALNGSTATADTFFTNPALTSTTTTTSNLVGSGVNGFVGTMTSTTPLILTSGDQITTIPTTAVAFSVVHVLQEF
jgi:hypothetical protein